MVVAASPTTFKMVCTIPQGLWSANTMEKISVQSSVLKPVPVKTAYIIIVPALATPGAPIDEEIASSVIVR